MEKLILMIERYSRNKKVQGMLWLLLGAVSVFMLAMFLHTRQYYKYNDAMYYYSVGCNLAVEGNLQNSTVSPPLPVHTPQNAITLAFAALLKMGLSREACFRAISILNFFFLWASVPPLLRIARYAGLTHPLARWGVAAGYLGNWLLFILLCVPINDGIFYCGFIVFLALVFRIQQQDRQGQKMTLYEKAAILLISAVLVHFRINAVFVPLAAITACLFTKQVRLAAWMILSILVMVASQALTYAFIENGFDRMVDHHHARFAPMLAQMLYDLVFLTIPAALYDDMGHFGNLMVFPFYLAFAAAVIEGIVRKNFVLLTLGAVCIGTLIMTLMITHLETHYLVGAYPFLYLFTFRDNVLRPFAWLFVILIVVSTLWRFYDGIDVPAPVRYWSCIEQNVPLQKDKTIVLSERSNRACWTFTGLPTQLFHQYDWQDLLRAQHIYVEGSNEYTSGQFRKIAEMAAAHGMKMETQHLSRACPEQDQAIHELKLIKSDDP